MTIVVHELLGRRPALSAGILTADLLRLGEELDLLREAGIDLVHIDVMDGVFCPGLTVGPPIVNVLPEGFVVDVHLMIDDPITKVAQYVEAGADIVTFHLEATRHPHRVLQSLATSGVVRGVALNPGTPVEAVEPLLDDLELILLLGVNPGYGGRPSCARLLLGRPVHASLLTAAKSRSASTVASRSPTSPRSQRSTPTSSWREAPSLTGERPRRTPVHSSKRFDSRAPATSDSRHRQDTRRLGPDQLVARYRDEIGRARGEVTTPALILDLDKAPPTSR